MSPGALRTLLGVSGAIAGLSYWAILDEGALQGLPVSLQLFLSYLIIGAFPAFGLIAGPVPPTNAALRALAIAGFGAALVAWAGFRFEGLADEHALEPTGEGLFIGPFLALTSLLIPFAIAHAHAPIKWRDYTTLFDTAWSAVVKSVVTLLFVLLFWAVYMLSNALLELVGIGLLEDIAQEDWGWPALSGLVAGLSLAVTCELDAVILTLRGLILRLLRLLLIPVTAVIAVFLVAVLVQGLGQVFRGFSAAATMMLITAGAVTLIAAVLGHDDKDASDNRTLLLAARGLALMLPVIAAIAVYAVWLRVDQYGWTPARLAAFIISLIVVAYALPPAIFAVRASVGWMHRIRTGFVAVVLGIVVAATLWFTPLLNAQRIAANDQFNRIMDGRVDVAEFNFWPLAREWGVAGLARVDALRTEVDHPNATQIAQRIEATLNAKTRWQAANQTREVLASDLWQDLRDQLPTLPEGRTLPQVDNFGSHDTDTLERVQRGCDISHPDGMPLCAAVFGNFLTDTPGEEVMIVAQTGPTAQPNAYLLLPGADKYTAFRYVDTGRWADPAGLFPALHAGTYTIAPPAYHGIRIGEDELMPNFR